MGDIYIMKGEYDKAKKYLKRSLKLSEGKRMPHIMRGSLSNNFREEAQQYLTQLKDLADNSEDKYTNHAYIRSKASLLKTSGRRRNRAEAELLLKQLVGDDTITPTSLVEDDIIAPTSLIDLCDLLLEELKIYILVQKYSMK